MPKEVFEFPCPCCGKRIELNTRNGKARALRVEEKLGGKSFDDLVDSHKHESSRLGSAFDDARADHAGQEEHLEKLLDQAKKEAKKREDERPPHPFLHD